LKGLIGKKIGMTQVFDEDGNLVPVTVIDASTCTVVGKRTPERDRYSAVTLGFGKAKEKRLTSADKGAFKKAGVEPRRLLKEFRLTADEVAAMNVGDAVGVQSFEKGQLVDVTGITKGRGFQGVMKRWNFAGFGQTHGTHEYRRHPGAIGQRKTPGRVYPNKKMPGHYGAARHTETDLRVEKVDAERNLIYIRGSVAGPTNGIVLVRKQGS